MKEVHCWVGQDQRDVIVEITLTGFDSVEEAKTALAASLRKEGPSGDAAGPVVRVSVDTNGIDVETERCGFGIDNAFIERAVRANGQRVCEFG